jgi:hypothetical protein
VSRTLDRGSTLYPRAIPARRRAPREEPHSNNHLWDIGFATCIGIVSFRCHSLRWLKSMGWLHIGTQFLQAAGFCSIFLRRRAIRRMSLVLREWGTDRERQPRLLNKGDGRPLNMGGPTTAWCPLVRHIRIYASNDLGSCPDPWTQYFNPKMTHPDGALWCLHACLMQDIVWTPGKRSAASSAAEPLCSFLILEFCYCRGGPAGRWPDLAFRPPVSPLLISRVLSPHHSLNNFVSIS